MPEFASDADLLDLDDKGAYAQILASVKEESKHDNKPLLICVSSTFVNVSNGFAYYCITFPKPVKFFILKAEFHITNLKICYKKRNALTPKIEDNRGWTNTSQQYNLKSNECRDKSIH